MLLLPLATLDADGFENGGVADGGDAEVEALEGVGGGVGTGVLTAREDEKQEKEERSSRQGAKTGKGERASRREPERADRESLRGFFMKII